MVVADYENGMLCDGLLIDTRERRNMCQSSIAFQCLVEIFVKIMAFIGLKALSGYSIKVRQQNTKTNGNILFIVTLVFIACLSTCMRIAILVDLVNANQSILPNITLGYQIRDSCWYAPVALEQTIEFIGNSVLNMGESTAQSNDVSRARLIAIIGPGDSSITMQTHNILQLFEMPQIGYSSTARQLSDKEKFKYFTRVIASDIQQAQAMVDIIRQFRWSYVATIGTEGKTHSCRIETIQSI
jgi:hypothetical protein